jgi:hypothetical protein
LGYRACTDFNRWAGTGHGSGLDRHITTGI